MKSKAEWWLKANAVASAVGGEPKMQTVVMYLTIAEGETACGEATGWEGEHNWGATTARALHADEHAVLEAAGVRATVDLRDLRAREFAARAAIAAAVAAGKLSDPGPTVALHCDSAPTTGPYFVWFAAFPDDVAGAKYFASFFRAAAERDALASGAPYAMASAMYAAGYFKGFHVGHGLYEQREGRWVLLMPGEGASTPTKTGAELNIAAYASTLERLGPVIRAALVGWTPGAEPEVYAEPAAPDPEVGSTAWVQDRLNIAGASPALDVDGKIGPKTQAALRAYQKGHGLKITGTATQATIDVLGAA